MSAALIRGSEIGHQPSTLLTAEVYHRIGHGNVEPAVGKRGLRRKSLRQSDALTLVLASVAAGEDCCRSETTEHGRYSRLHCAESAVKDTGAFGRMESNTAALMKILDSLEKQERMVKSMLEDRRKQLKGSKPQPAMLQLTASTTQVSYRSPIF